MTTQHTEALQRLWQRFSRDQLEGIPLEERRQFEQMFEDRFAELVEKGAGAPSSGDGFLDLLNGGGAPAVEVRGGGEACVADKLLGEPEAIGAGFGELQLIGDVVGIVMLPVAAEAENGGDHHLRAVAGAGAVGGAADDIEAVGEIVAAGEGVALDAVAGGALDEVRALAARSGTIV